MNYVAIKVNHNICKSFSQTKESQKKITETKATLINCDVMLKGRKEKPESPLICHNCLSN